MARSPDLQQNRSMVETVKDMRRPKTITDTGWIRIGNPDDPIAPPFEDTWEQTDIPTVPAGFHLSEEGEVRGRGKVKNGAVGSTITTFPEDFRPEKETLITVSVDDDGNIDLSGVRFRAWQGAE